MIIQIKRYRLARLFLWWTVVFLLFISFGCARYEVKNIYSRGKDIICFGNSITAGSGFSKRETYPYFLSELLGCSVINAGREGDTSSDGLERLEKDVLTYQPRLVIVEFGGNDYIHPNAEGHRILASKIYRAIKPYLER